MASMQQGAICAEGEENEPQQVIRHIFGTGFYALFQKPIFIICTPEDVDIYLADFEKRKGIKELTFRVCLLPEIAPDADLANGECDLYLDLSKGAKYVSGLLHHFIMRVGK